MTFNFIKNRKVFFAISIILVVVSVVCFLVRGFNLDIEFIGGTEYTFDLQNGATLDKDALSGELSEELGDGFSSIRVAGDNSFIVRTTLEGTDYDFINSAIISDVEAGFEVTDSTSTNNSIVVTVTAEKTPEVVDEENAEAAEAAEAAEETTEEKKMEDKIKEVIVANSESLGIEDVKVTPVPEKENEYEITYHSVSVVSDTVKNYYTVTTTEEATEDGAEAVEITTVNVKLSNEITVSAEVSDSLKATAFWAAFVAIVLMLVYIAFRFEGRASLAAIVCLAHDILMVMLAYSIFQIPVSSTIIAVILTIFGYSINATIVIFDRIRENRKNITSQYTFEDAADSGIKSTLMRSLNTTITTLITIGLIYFMGVTSIKNFALPLIVGIIAGVYSSVCLSGNVWVALKKIGSKK